MTNSLGHGMLDLTFARARDGTTRLVQRAQRYPLHFTTAMHLDDSRPGMATVVVQNPAGGVFADDLLEMRFVARPESQVAITTGSATKVYAMGGSTAQQRTQLVAEAGSLIEYLPQLVIPQRDSSLDQLTEIDLHESATCVVIDTFAPGRFARGELFAYRRLALTTRIRSADGPEAAVDSMLIEPWRRAPEARGAFGRFPYVGTIVVATRGDNRALAEAMDEALGRETHVHASAAALPGNCGVLGRVLAESSLDLRRVLDAVHGRVRALLATEPLRVTA